MRISKISSILCEQNNHIFPILALLCLYVFWGYVINTTALTYQAYDPEFHYFIASLEPFKGQSYSYIDHPGTPLEMLGTAFDALTLPFVGGNRASLIDYELRHPQLFFNIAYGFLLLSNLGCCLYFYFTAYSCGHVGKWSSLALALMFFALANQTLGTIANWSHVAFIFPFGTFFLLALFRIVQRSGGELRNQELIGLGFGAGILTSIVIYLSAWVVGTVVTLLVFYWFKRIPRIKTMLAMATVILSSVAGFFIFAFPILLNWPKFSQWMLKLSFHQGRLGKGPAGVISFSGSVKSLAQLLGQTPIMFWVLAFTIVFLFYVLLKQRKNLAAKEALWSLAVGLIFQILFLLVMISKSPFGTYLLSVQAVVPVLLLILMCLVKDSLNLRVILGLLVPIFVFSSVSVYLYQNTIRRIQVSNYIVQDHSHLISAIAQIAREMGKSPDKLSIIWGYGVYEQCNALLSGNALTYKRITFYEELARICPRQYLLTDKRVAQIHGRRIPIAHTMHPTTLVIIRKINAEYLFKLLPKIKIKEVPVYSNSSYGPILIIHE